MSAESHSDGIAEQDRTLTDLLESYRHKQADPNIPDDRKQRAAERMKDVWANLAKLQDPDGFINHLSEYIQHEHQRRNHAEGSDLTKRGRPLCRCDLSRHVCEVKDGEVPSKIRTQDLTYLSKPGNRTLAREYVQDHSGDVVVREAMESYRDLRADIYGELSDILAMMMGGPTAPREDGADGERQATASEDVRSPTDGGDGAVGGTAAADGGGGDGE